MSIETLTTAARAAGFAMAISEEWLEPQGAELKPERQAEPARDKTLDSRTMLVTRVQPSAASWWAFWKAPA